MDGATVSKLLADKWKMMSDAEKSRWYNEQERMKNLHQLQHPNYKYNPKMRPKKLSMKQSVARIDPTLAPISIASVMSQAGPNIMSQTGAIISQGGPMMSPSGIILSQTTASTHSELKSPKNCNHLLCLYSNYCLFSPDTYCVNS